MSPSASWLVIHACIVSYEAESNSQWYTRFTGQSFTKERHQLVMVVFSDVILFETL